MIKNKNFSEKDSICNLLIEARLFHNYSSEFINSLLSELENFTNKNGYDMVVDLLFIKYLKKMDNISSNFVKSMNYIQKIKSQYHICFLCFTDSSDKLKFKNKIKNQSLKIVRNENISINGIIISNVIAFYIFKKFYNYFKFKGNISIVQIRSGNESTSNDDVFLNLNNDQLNIYKTPHYFTKNDKEKNEIIQKYNDFKANPNEYFELDFWRSANIYEVIDNYSIDVQDNPYLFNAGACLSYLNPCVKVVYNLRNLKFPEKITFDLYQLLFFKLSLEQLLQYKPYSKEVKNLCSLIYLLILYQKKLGDLALLKNEMNPISYEILRYIYAKQIGSYFNGNSFEDLSFLNAKIDVKNPDDFAKLHFYKIKGKYFEIINKNNEFLYFKKGSILDTYNKSPENYGYSKICFMNSSDNVRLLDPIYEEDFIRFVGCAIPFLNGKKKKNAIYYLARKSYSLDTKINILLNSIDSDDYEEAKNILNEIEPTKEAENILKDSNNRSKIQKLLSHVSIECSTNIMKKYNLDELLTDEVKFDIYYNRKFPVVKFNISRNMLFNDSICYFLDTDMKNKSIYITYVDELASDEGGLSRDWFINVSKEIINTEIFIPTPNGNSLTFNHQNEDMMLYNFTGKFIGAAFNNKRNINIKLASFIWKKIFEEEVTLEDMKEYDSDMYESLKWISENDPSLLEMTFIDSNENELCLNGADILVTEENKNEYIRLIIKSKLINENLELIDCLANGFREVVDFNYITLFKSKNIQEIINGKEIIDINDWKQNSNYNKEFSKQYNDFFIIISAWSQENLQKLLSFVTGSSIVPFGGFKNLEKNGGLFTIHFNKNSIDALPTSHTCFNKIEIPCYPSIKIFEEKLLLAIQCDSFGFS